MFVETWRAWLTEHLFIGKHQHRARNPASPGWATRQGGSATCELLEDRFLLGQLTLPDVSEVEALELPDEGELHTESAAVTDPFEEIAKALEAAFSEIDSAAGLENDPGVSGKTSGRAGSEDLITAKPGPHTQRFETLPIDETNVASDSDFDSAAFEFGTLSDVAHAELLLDSLKTGDPVALSKAELRKAARSEKRQGRSEDSVSSNDSNSGSATPGLMTQDSGSSAAPSSSVANSNQSGLSAGTSGNPSFPVISTGSSENTGTWGNSTPLDQVMSSWGDIAFSMSPSTSNSTPSNNGRGEQTYLSGTSSKAESLASLAGDPQLTIAEVQTLLERASKATPSEDAIIAVVDRQGNILGVRTEAGVSFPDVSTLVFAIDGAVAKARTAAFFSSDQGALTSRTVRFISQSTVTQREVESNPSIADLNSTLAGPGFVGPIGLGGHYPPNVREAPVVDLFGIEHTNRDSIDQDDGALGRFNALFDAGKEIDAPGSFGRQSGLSDSAQPRGIATLPGGLPLYRDTGDADQLGDTLVGGIGVFFPGPDGYATFEQGFQQGDGKTTTSRTNAPKVLESEFIAVAAAGGSRGAGLPVGTIGGTPAVMGLDLPFARIDLAGITLEGVGPTAGIEGVKQLKNKFIGVLGTGASSGVDRDVVADATPDVTYLTGQAVPTGWLVSAHASADGSLTKADVERIINQGISEAKKTRAAIRALPTIGQRTRMVFSVTDKNGEILGLYRMPDATYFSIDVAVAKARNVSYYADASKLKDVDKISSVPKGTAFTNRTFRFLAEPRYPSGVDGSKPPPFSILNEKSPGGVALINKKNGENVGAAAPANWFNTVLGYDAFHIGTNFRDDTPAAAGLQNGVVFFPGSSALYKGGVLVGGLGVSGDGVDQDDGVTAAATAGFTPPSSIKADRYTFAGVRLPYFKFVRNPYG